MPHHSPRETRAERNCRATQAQLVAEDVDQRGTHLTQGQRAFVKEKLVDKPSHFRPQDWSGFRYSVNDQRVDIEPDGMMKYTGCITTDHIIPALWYGTHRPKERRRRIHRADREAGGHKIVEWSSDEEVLEGRELRRMRRLNRVEDKPTSRQHNGTTGEANTTFKSSLVINPSLRTPLYSKSAVTLLSTGLSVEQECWMACPRKDAKHEDVEEETDDCCALPNNLYASDQRASKQRLLNSR